MQRVSLGFLLSYGYLLDSSLAVFFVKWNLKLRTVGSKFDNECNQSFQTRSGKTPRQWTLLYQIGGYPVMKLNWAGDLDRNGN